MATDKDNNSIIQTTPSENTPLFYAPRQEKARQKVRWFAQNTNGLFGNVNQNALQGAVVLLRVLQIPLNDDGLSVVLQILHHGDVDGAALRRPVRLGEDKAGGVVGATVGAGIEAMYSVGEVIRGKKDVVDAAGDIAYAGAKGGASGYAGAAAGTVAAGATSAAIAATGIATGVAATGAAATAVALAPVVVGFGAACVVGSFVSDLFDDIFG